jgi:hypothetical protein
VVGSIVTSAHSGQDDCNYMKFHYTNNAGVSMAHECVCLCVLRVLSNMYAYCVQ